MAKDKVFIDSSVLIAAILSSRGGSFYILEKFKDKFEFHINRYILDEILDVLNRKFGDNEILKDRLFLLLGLADVKILSDIPKNKLKSLTKLLSEKDAPILASALENSSYLITLDNDFLKEGVLEFAKTKGLIILKPREFIEKLRK